MKKAILLMAILTLASILTARDLLLVNYVFSAEGAGVMAALEGFVEDTDWLSLTNKEEEGDLCLFVKEHQIPAEMDPVLRSFTITVALVERPFGDYGEYVPISEAVSGTWFVATESFLMKADDMAAGLEAMIQSLAPQLFVFLSTYGNVTYEDEDYSREARIETTLNEYCALTLEWYLEDESQGGAGKHLTASSGMSLARYLGFEEEGLFIERLDHATSYVISNYGEDFVEIEVYPMDASYVDGPLYTGRIDLVELSFSIIRNPVYD